MQQEAEEDEVMSPRHAQSNGKRQSSSKSLDEIAENLEAQNEKNSQLDIET